MLAFPMSEESLLPSLFLVSLSNYNVIIAVAVVVILVSICC